MTARQLIPSLIICAAIHAWSASPITLSDVTAKSGIDFVHTDGSSGKRYVVETVASGLALFDYNNDGKVDIYFLNGAPLKGTSSPTPPVNSLWRNEGNWRFTNVTKTSGLGDTGYGTGVATADYDNDGDQDVYISNYGPNKLYRNNNDGTFTDVTAAAGVTDGANRIGAGVAFFDMDQDGDLDLFSAHYVEFDYANHKTVRFNGHLAYVGPLEFQPSHYTLFRNNGDGTFTDVSKSAGLAEAKGAGMGVVCFDADMDGDIDIFVGNDKTGNLLFLNDGKGVFEESGGLAGVAYDFAGRSLASMGVECADVNNDGLLDLYITTYQQEPATLFKNVGDGFFDDATRLSRAGTGTLRYVKWGVGIFDFDNDSNRDLFIASGHLHDNVHLFDTSTLYECPSIVLHNQGNGTFKDISAEAGNALSIKKSTRGAAFDDLDNDGDIDVVLANSRQGPTLMRNDSPPASWLRLKLAGTQSNRDAIGAYVRVIAGDTVMVDEVRSGRGYQSDYARTLHFGLGSKSKIDRIEIRWPNGKKTTHPAVPINQTHEIQE